MVLMMVTGTTHRHINAPLQPRSFFSTNITEYNTEDIVMATSYFLYVLIVHTNSTPYRRAHLKLGLLAFVASSIP